MVVLTSWPITESNALKHLYVRSSPDQQHSVLHSTEEQLTTECSQLASQTKQHRFRASATKPKNQSINHGAKKSL